MLNEMGRREFLKVTATTGAVLLTGDFLRGSSVAHGSVKIPEAEKIMITIITDNFVDTIVPDYKVAKRYRVKPGTDLYKRYLHAEHGLACHCHIETVVNGHVHSFLFDYGVDFQGVSRNMELLNIDFKILEALGLSHGHFDHRGALLAILKSKKEEIRKGIPFYAGEEAFEERFTKRPEGLSSSGQLKKEDLENLSLVKILEIKDPTPLVPGAFMTGRIERVTEYEKVPATLMIKRGDKIEHDTFIGEQAVVLNAKGKGLVVLSSCAHAGIVNTVKHAQKMTAVEKVHAVMGGFHLTGAKAEVIQRTIADIKAIAPDYIIPMHCTGFEAITGFAREMPDQFILNTVGTRYVFAA